MVTHDVMGILKQRIAIQKKKNRAVRSALRNKERVPKEDLATLLRWNIPRSEKWFQSHWKASGMLDHADLFNRSFGEFIPDLRNSLYKYIVEIDGSIHSDAKEKYKDKIKDQFYADSGYIVFRITSFDRQQLDKVISQIKHIRLATLGYG